MSEHLRKIYAVFEPAPLKPGQYDLYVNLDEVRGDTGVVREAIIAGDLPIKTAALRRCREDTERTYRRFLRSRALADPRREARTTGRVTRSSENEQPMRELLESRALLLYRNDVEWYGLHPAVEEIEPPKPPSKAYKPAED